jgi:hypothetical protein
MERLAINSSGAQPRTLWARPQRNRKRATAEPTAAGMKSKLARLAAASPAPSQSGLAFGGSFGIGVAFPAFECALHPEQERAHSAADTLRGLLSQCTQRPAWPFVTLAPVPEEQPLVATPPRANLLTSFQYETFEFDDDDELKDISSPTWPTLFGGSGGAGGQALVVVASHEAPAADLDLFQD